MAKLADASALGADGATLGGSSPLPPMILVAEEDSKRVSSPLVKVDCPVDSRQFLRRNEWPTGVEPSKSGAT